MTRDAERHLRTHHEARLAVVEAVNYEVRKRVLRDVRRDARHFAGAHGFFADVLDGVVVHAWVQADQVVSALALPGDVDQYVHGLLLSRLGGFACSSLTPNHSPIRWE